MHKPSKCLDNNDDVNLTLLQMKLTPICAELTSPATLLFNRPIRAILPKMDWKPISFNADYEQYGALNASQDKYIKGNDIHKDSFSVLIGCTTTAQCRWVTMDT